MEPILSVNLELWCIAVIRLSWILLLCNAWFTNSLKCPHLTIVVNIINEINHNFSEIAFELDILEVYTILRSFINAKVQKKTP